LQLSFFWGKKGKKQKPKKKHTHTQEKAENLLAEAVKRYTIKRWEEKIAN
jgi:hypothetical protein